MAPYTNAESARSPQRKANRPAPAIPRIVPAIPLAFTRPARATQPTPATSREDAAAQPEDGSEADTPPDTTAGRKVSASGLHYRAPTVEEEDGVTVSEQGATAGSSDGLMTSGDVQGQSSLPSSDQNSQIPSQSPSSELPPQTSPVSEQQSPQEPAGETLRKGSHEFPPSIHPSENHSTPTSTTSSSFPPPQQSQPHPRPVTMHHPRPSASSLVFGGFADSSSSSPAPPPSAGFPPYPPPGFVPTNFSAPPFPPSAHPHHVTEQHPHMFHPAMHMPPPDAYGYKHPPPHYFARPQPQPWFPPSGHMPYPTGMPGQIPAHNRLPYVNGETHTPRSLSQSSSKTQDPDASRRQNQDAGYAPTVTGANHQPLGLELDGHSASTPSSQEVPSRAQDDSAVALRDYLNMHFGNQHFADYILELSHVKVERPLYTIPVHGVIVARSPTLLSLMVNQGRPLNYTDRGPKVLRISSSDQFLNAYGFTEALRYLYGGPLLEPREFISDLQPFNLRFHNPDTSCMPQQRMEHALAYVAAGNLLRVPPIFMRGIDIARALLRWDTVEKALTFALDNLPISPLQKQGTGFSDVEPSSKRTYDVNGTRMMNGISDFLVHNFPTDFALDPAAPQLIGNPRLPATRSSRPSMSHPRLGLIQFGEVPLEETVRPDFITKLLSTILLSLPFLQLKSLLKHHGLGRRLGWDQVGKVMHAVTEEREARRLKVLKSKGFPPDPAGAAGELWQNTQWEERVEPDAQHGSGLTIVRRWRGIDAASGTTTNGSG